MDGQNSQQNLATQMAVIIRRPNFKRNGRTYSHRIKKDHIMKVFDPMRKMDEERREAIYTSIDNLANTAIKRLEKNLGGDTMTFSTPWKLIDSDMKAEAIETFNQFVFEKYTVQFHRCEIDWCANHMLGERWRSRHCYRARVDKRRRIQTPDDGIDKSSRTVPGPMDDIQCRLLFQDWSIREHHDLD
ncbi:hypothetical protein BX666DRAFT_2123138 [Dichotomocladium elegans]|nr:hypothetical protein BX666DRAFT_2123138 [Dichotomocladium elegans]